MKPNKKNNYFSYLLKSAAIFYRYILILNVRLKSVLHGCLFFPSPATMANDFEDFLSKILSYYIFVLAIIIFENEPVFPYLMLSVKQGK